MAPSAHSSMPEKKKFSVVEGQSSYSMARTSGNNNNNNPSVVSPSSAGWKSSMSDMHLMLAPETSSGDGKNNHASSNNNNNNHGVPGPLSTSSPYVATTSPGRLGSGLMLARGNSSSWSTSAVEMSNKLGCCSPIISAAAAASSSSAVLALQGAGAGAGAGASGGGGIAATSSHCLAHFSSDPGFAERAAKFSSLSSNGGNYFYSQTPYALAPPAPPPPPDGCSIIKPRGGGSSSSSRSMIAAAAGDNNNNNNSDNDGKHSRSSSSCSRLATVNLAAAPSCITTVRNSSRHGSADSNAPEIKKVKDLQATAMEYEDGSRSDMEKLQSPVLRDDDKKKKKLLLQQQQAGGGGGVVVVGDIAAAATTTTTMEAFEGAMEIDGSDPNNVDTDDADGLEYSSCYEQACGDGIEEEEEEEERKKQQQQQKKKKQTKKQKLLFLEAAADESLLLHNKVEPGGRRNAGDGDEFKAKRQRSSSSGGEEDSSTKEEEEEDAQLQLLLQGTDRTLSESYSGDSSPLSAMKDSAKLSEQQQQQQQQQQPQQQQQQQAPKQDYIHVRARRGQATDSHSLAERVRREKIGERMKVLQDLVPGCSKVTGKAVMLDEIINYVQSLQRQVEFLSMKLAAVNPRLDFEVENFLAKEMQSHASTAMMMGPDPTAISYGHQQQPQQPHQVHNLQLLGPSGLDFAPAKSASEACIRRTMSAPVAAPCSCFNAFADNLSQVKNLQAKALH